MGSEAARTKEREADLLAALTQTYIKLAAHESVEPRAKWTRDLLAFAADELYDDYYRGRRRPWIGRGSNIHPNVITCPACRQVERVAQQEAAAFSKKDKKKPRPIGGAAK